MAVQNIGEAILVSFTNALNLVFAFVPKLIAFLVILIIGLIVATLISKALVFLLRKIGFDRLSNRIGLTGLEQRMGVTIDPAGILGKVVYYFIFLIFLIPAVDALGLTTVSNILNSLVSYIPNIFVAILVLFLGTLAATFLADIVRGLTASTNIGNPNIFAGIARYAIIGFAALIALQQLQIAPALISLLFAAIVFAAALAFGLAFGLGGQDSARRMLARSENSLNSAAIQLQVQQNADEIQATQARTEQIRKQQV